MYRYPPHGRICLAIWLGLVVATRPSIAQESAPSAPAGEQSVAAEPPAAPERPSPPVDPRWKQLDIKLPLWLDKENKTVIAGGEVCFREGPLEMFACPRHTKEHESVVSVAVPAFAVHAALLATGAKPGTVVQFTPEYRAATGPVIDVSVEWVDANGKKQRVRGQDWVRHMPTGKAMTHEWVFAGSGFDIDEETGERHYLANGGELICVSNFSTAMLDLTVDSSAQNATLLFGAFTERIPPLGTRVHLLLTPKKPATEKQADAKSTTPPATKRPTNP